VTGTRRRPIVWRALLLGCVGTVLLMARPIRLWPHAEGPPFERSRWLAGKTWSEAPNPRHDMVESLLAHRHLRGKTRAEVIALLGVPDGVGGVLRGDLKVPASASAQSTEFDYLIGMALIDYEFLALHFGTDGRVSGWEIGQS
jgi:hypothetical protein